MEFRRGSTYFTDEVYLLWRLKYISYREGSGISWKWLFEKRSKGREKWLENYLVSRPTFTY